VVLARINLRPFLASVDWLAMGFGVLIGGLYGWYLRGAFNATRSELNVSQLEVDSWVVVTRSGRTFLPRLTRMRVTSIDNETVSFYAQAVGMTVVAYRNGPRRDQLSDAGGRHMKIYRSS